MPISLLLYFDPRSPPSWSVRPRPAAFPAARPPSNPHSFPRRPPWQAGWSGRRPPGLA